MALSSIDYEKVDMQMLSVIQQINGLEQVILALPVDQTVIGNFVVELDRFRNAVALEIEKQGSR